jgi:polyisoprenyl-teichoic acid--peptidoglycan teichoic acid transferase
VQYASRSIHDDRSAVAATTGKKRRSKDPTWARLLVVFGAILMMLAGVLIGGSKIVLAEATRSVTQTNLLGNSASHHASVNGAKNILLIGIDARRGEIQDKTYLRSDSIIILHINAAHTAAYMVSIPRDLYVEIPGHGSNKINSAFAFGGAGMAGTPKLQGGAQLLAQTIRTDFNIQPDAAAIISFQGFVDVVRVLGSVRMYVDETTKSIHHNMNPDGSLGNVSPFKLHTDGTIAYAIPGITPMEYTKGWHTLTAAEALDFVRQRDLLANNDYDYGRQRHQQQFIKAVFQQIFTAGVLANPIKLDRVLNTVGKAMTIDNGGVSLEDWIWAMRNINPSNLYTIKTNGGRLYGENLPGIGDVQKLMPASYDLLQAVRDDTVVQFIQEHPDWVAG